MVKIKDDDHYNRVIEEIRQLMTKTLTVEESDYVTKLIDSVQEYKNSCIEKGEILNS